MPPWTKFAAKRKHYIALTRKLQFRVHKDFKQNEKEEIEEINRHVDAKKTARIQQP